MVGSDFPYNGTRADRFCRRLVGCSRFRRRRRRGSGWRRCQRCDHALCTCRVPRWRRQLPVTCGRPWRACLVTDSSGDDLRREARSAQSSFEHAARSWRGRTHNFVGCACGLGAGGVRLVGCRPLAGLAAVQRRGIRRCGNSGAGLSTGNRRTQVGRRPSGSICGGAGWLP